MLKQDIEDNDVHQAYLMSLMRGHFDTKRDEDGMQDWLKLMKLGCFGKEFLMYGVAYSDGAGKAYRTSGNVNNLYRFIKYSGVEGYYPTPIICNAQRRFAPSGLEDDIKKMLKKETAFILREMYNEQYFFSMERLGKISANNEAYQLLIQMMEYLDGRYIRSELELFEGLLLECVNRKVLTIEKYSEFALWLKDVYKQMEDDIIMEGRHEKTLSGFAFKKKSGKIGFFEDAFLQTTYEKHEAYEMQGVLVTPIFERTYWLKEMGEFSQIKKDFKIHLEECFDEHYWKIYDQILHFHTPIKKQLYLEELDGVQKKCSEKAFQNIIRYGRRWGVVDYVGI